MRIECLFVLEEREGVVPRNGKNSHWRTGEGLWCLFDVIVFFLHVCVSTIVSERVSEQVFVSV